MTDHPSLDPADYADEDVDDAENPEWTAEDFQRARPLHELESPG